MLVFLAFLGLTGLEIFILVRVGQTIGGWSVVALLAGGVFVGGLILRYHGMMTLLRVRRQLAAGGAPVRPVIEGAAVLLAGALFMLPGFLSDVVALLLLVPPVRRALISLVVRAISTRLHRAAGTASSEADGVIDADFHEVRPEAPQFLRKGPPPG